MSKPKADIRRFDVFAEYNRQEAIRDGLPEDEAMGYGLWLAKLVAGRRFKRSLLSQSPSKVRETAPPEPEEKGQPQRGKWRSLSGKPQTDELFEKEIVERMGRTFYQRVFVPAIRKAIRSGESYTDIRDSLREGWKA